MHKQRPVRRSAMPTMPTMLYVEAESLNGCKTADAFIRAEDRLSDDHEETRIMAKYQFVGFVEVAKTVSVTPFKE